MAELVFGKYEIQHRLAIGGMGEVFYAVQSGVPGFERPAILKSLLPDLAQQEGFIDQFLDEARVAATLNHPNVVSIYEVGLWNGTYFIAMEYIRGRNLAQIIRRALEAQLPIPPHVAAMIIRDAALGLDHAHGAQDGEGRALAIIHRDISPQNIMVRDDGVTKVVDFGIARATNRSTRTQTGVLKGKLAYMAPEQILALPSVGPAVDQFALGVVFWELLTGRRLFKGESDYVVMQLVLEAPIERPSQIRPEIPQSVDDVVLRMLDRDPEKRFASCGEVASAISTALTALTPAGGVSPVTLLMRKLGTEDLQIRARPSAPSGNNFVISLRAPPPAPADLSVEVQLKTDALPNAALATRASALPKRRNRAVVAGPVAALALLLVGGFFWFRPQPAPLPAPVPVLPKKADDPPVVIPPVVVAPPPAPAHLHVATVPEGIVVRLDGRTLGVAPRDVELVGGTAHMLDAERPGFQRAEQEITLTPGEDRQVVLRLVPVQARPIGTTRPVPATPSVAKTEPGFLSLDTTPWSKVSIDGEPAGSTPLFKKKLAPGRHTLLLVNEGAGVHTTRAVEIRAGETQRLSLTL